MAKEGEKMIPSSDELYNAIARLVAEGDASATGASAPTATTANGGNAAPGGQSGVAYVPQKTEGLSLPQYGFGKKPGGFDTNAQVEKAGIKAPGGNVSFAEADAKRSGLANTNKAATATAPEEPNYGYAWLADQFKQNTKTKEEEARENRRAKANAFIHSLGDASRAVANMVYTDQYAPNAYTQENSAADKYNARLEKLKADYEADRARYLNYAMNVHNQWMANEKMKQDKEYKDAALAEKKRANDMNNLARLAALDERIRHNTETEAEMKEYHQLRNDLSSRGLDISQYNAVSNRIRANKAGSGGGSGKVKPEKNVILSEINAGLPEEYRVSAGYDKNGNEKWDYGKIEASIGRYLNDPKTPAADKERVRNQFRQNGYSVNSTGSVSSNSNDKRRNGGLK